MKAFGDLGGRRNGRIVLGAKLPAKQQVLSQDRIRKMLIPSIINKYKTLHEFARTCIPGLKACLRFAAEERGRPPPPPVRLVSVSTFGVLKNI